MVEQLGSHRVMFGTDTAPNAEAYRIYYRFLETDDEYFDPTGGHHLQGRWMIYGVHLPDEVLEKIYNKFDITIQEGPYNRENNSQHLD